jgi:hypothetical protein
MNNMVPVGQVPKRPIDLRALGNTQLRDGPSDESNLQFVIVS